MMNLQYKFNINIIFQRTLFIIFLIDVIIYNKTIQLLRP